MNILKKLVTAVKGAATEIGEAVVDSQALPILEQEIRDAKIHIQEAKHNLTQVMAEKMGFDREIKGLMEKITQHEDYTLQALDKQNETLALEISEKIANDINELETQQKIAEGYRVSINELKLNIKTAEQNIKLMEREIAIIKTTESVHKASATATEKYIGSQTALHSASQSLARIKERQQQRNDQIKAAMILQKESLGQDLQTKLKAAGIITNESSGNAILEKLKANRLKKQPIQ